MNIEESQQERCYLCNIPIFISPYNDLKSNDIFHKKGSILCNKCAATVQNIPGDQWIQAIANACLVYENEDE